MGKSRVTSLTPPSPLCKGMDESQLSKDPLRRISEPLYFHSNLYIILSFSISFDGESTRNILNFIDVLSVWTATILEKSIVKFVTLGDIELNDFTSIASSNFSIWKMGCENEGLLFAWYWFSIHWLVWLSKDILINIKI